SLHFFRTGPWRDECRIGFAGLAVAGGHRDQRPQPLGRPGARRGGLIARAGKWLAWAWGSPYGRLGRVREVRRVLCARRRIAPEREAAALHERGAASRQIEATEPANDAGRDNWPRSIAIFPSRSSRRHSIAASPAAAATGRLPEARRGAGG